MNIFRKNNLLVIGVVVVILIALGAVGYLSGWFGANASLSGAAGLINQDPLIGFHYQLSCSGRVMGYFTQVEGLGTQSEVVTRRGF